MKNRFVLTIMMITTLYSQAFIERKISKMSLNEKIGQMLMISFQGDFHAEADKNYKNILWSIKHFHIGGLILFKGNAYATAFQLNELQKLSKLPLLISSDFERGVYQQQDDGIHFPSNMAIGATRNTNYAYLQGKITAIEARAIGVHMILAPVLDVNNNPLNPIINYRSYGEDPNLVAEMGSAFIRGIQDYNAIATAKHFPGHGDTSFDSHIGLPVIDLDINRLDSVEFVPFKKAIKSNVKAIMTAHIAIPKLNNGKLNPATTSKELLTNYLRKKWKFKGLIISDAFNMKAVNMEGLSSKIIVEAVLSGIDIILMPMSVPFTFNAIKRAVQRKKISLKRINSSVRRILKAKYQLGLFKNRYVKLSKLKKQLEQEEYKKDAFKISRDAITWIRNINFPTQIRYQNSILNISISSEKSLENPGKTFYYQLKKYFRYIRRDIIDYRTDSLNLDAIKANAKNAQIIIVSLFSRTRGGKKMLGIQKREEKMLKKVLETITSPILIVSFGSPYIASDFANYQNHLAAFSYSRLMQRASAQAISNQSLIHGQMPVQVPFLNDTSNISNQWIPVIRFQHQNAYDTEKIDRLFQNAIRDFVFPGASMLIGNANKILFERAYGHFTYDRKSPKVRINTKYDLASLTKVLSTTISIMKLIDQSKLSLNSKLGTVLEEYAGTEKEEITIKHLLSHSSGLLWHKNFFETIHNKKEMFQAIFDEPLSSEIGVKTEYSDLGFILLMQIVERISGENLDRFVSKNFYRPMNLNGINYLPKNDEKNKIPPTEAVKWRNHMAQGEVHDENAMAMGGISGHAGLFGNVESIAAICQLFLREGEYKGRRYLSRRIMKRFSQRAGVVPNTIRALGWDKPSPISMAGKYFSDDSYGHSGFTGSTIWIDPKQNVFIILLTNRVYPNRKNRKISKFRPKFHNLMMETFSYDKLRKSYKKYLNGN